MKLPKKIINNLHRIAYHSGISKKLELEVEKWISSKGIDTEILRDGSGEGLEELGYGNDIADIVAKKIEAMLNK